MRRFAAPTFALLVVLATVAVVPLATGNSEQPSGSVVAVDDGPTGQGWSADGPAARPAAAVAPNGTSVDPPTGPPVETPNSSARMMIRDPVRTDRAVVNESLTGALSGRVEGLQGKHKSQALEVRFNGLSSKNARTNLLIRELIPIGERTEKLVREQHRAIRAYANGNLSEEAFLRKLAAIHRAASALDSRLEKVESLALRIDVFYLDNKMQHITPLVTSLLGPVRERVVDALEAGAGVPEVSVEATESAVVLSLVEDGRYVRESFFHDNLQFDGSMNSRYNGTLQLDQGTKAFSQAAKYYPWVWGQLRDIDQTPWGNAYRYTPTHRHGQLTTYLDGYSGWVFREVQNLRLSALPTTTIRNVSDAGLRIVLERTYPGGPMRVEVYDAASGNPVDAAVSIGPESVGATGGDGTLWLVEPRTDYALAVSQGAENVSVTVSPP
jgi:hypothetical protein